MLTLRLTDNSRHVSQPVVIDNMEFPDFANNYMLPFVNKTILDDDYASIRVTVDFGNDNPIIHSYYRRTSNDYWEHRISEDRYMYEHNIHQEWQWKWQDMVNAWTRTLKYRKVLLLKFEIRNIDRLHLDDLETFFGRTMYVNRNSSEITILVMVDDC